MRLNPTNITSKAAEKMINLCHDFVLTSGSVNNSDCP